jgi:hypothetical protein
MKSLKKNRKRSPKGDWALSQNQAGLKEKQRPGQRHWQAMPAVSEARSPDMRNGQESWWLQ